MATKQQANPAAVFLDQIRTWLKDGATISALDPKKPTIQFRANGTIDTNLKVSFPGK